MTLFCCLISFVASEEETDVDEIAVDDIMSLTASDAEEWGCSGEELKALPPSHPAQPKLDSKLTLFTLRRWRILAWSGRSR